MSDLEDLEAKINLLWEHRDELGAVEPEVEAAVHVREAIDLLDSGQARVAEVVDDEIVVHQWLKQAILLLFRLTHMNVMELGPFEFRDKIPLKRNYEQAGVRVVPGAQARWGSFLAPGVVMMPSYVNIGAYVGEDTMVDTWATVGSCAQIGARVHLSGGVGIGGVLEPPDAVPIVVGDDTMIGSRCIVAAGARVGQRRRARRRMRAHRLDPGDRRRDRRGAQPRGRPRLVRRGGGDPAPHLPGRRVRPGLRAGREAAHRGRAPRQVQAQRDPARARRQHVTSEKRT